MYKIGIIVLSLILIFMFVSDLQKMYAQMTDAEIQKLIEDKIQEKNENLDRRAESINWWLTILGLIVAVFGVAIPILIALATFFSFRKVHKLEKEARSIIDKFKTEAQKFKKDVQRILADSEKYSEAIKEKYSEVNDLVDGSSGKTIPKPDKKTAEIIEEISKKPDSFAINEKEITDAYKLQQDGKIHEAIEKWRIIADTAQGKDKKFSARVWAYIGELYIISDNQTISNFNKAQALYALDKAIELNPDYAEAYNIRGIVKFSLDADHEAIDDYNKAIDLKGGNAKSYNGLALVKYYLEEYQDAINDCDRAIQLRPDVAHKLRGDANTAINKYDDALKDYNKAIHYEPDNAEAYLGRANVNFLLNKYEDAIDDLDKTINLNCEHAKAHALRGTIKWGSGRINEAIQDFQIGYKIAKQQGHLELALYLDKRLQELNNSSS